MCYGIVTESIARCSDRMAEVSKGHSSCIGSQGPNGSRKGLKEAVSRRRDS